MSTALTREQSRITGELDRLLTKAEKLKTIEDILARPIETVGIREWLRRIYLDMTESADA